MKDTTALDDALRGYPHLRSLTPREIEVMECVARRLSDKEIAVALGIAPRTVGSQINVIRGKLQVLGKNRNALIAAYIVTRKT